MVDQPHPGVVIRPMGVGEVLDSGFTLARRNFRLLALTIAWGVIPGYVLYSIVLLAMSTPGAARESILVAIVGGISALVGALILAIGVGLATIASVIACARLIEPTGAPTQLEAGSLYRAALGRLGYSILWGIVFFLVSIPLVILLPLGIYIWVRWAVSWPALIVERIGPIAALGRSWNLTRGLWWHTLGVVVAIVIISIVLSAVIGGIFGAAAAGFLAIGNLTISTLANTIGSAISTIVFGPFSAALTVVLYYELRARREGFDLEQRGRMASPIP